MPNVQQTKFNKGAYIALAFMAAIVLVVFLKIDFRIKIAIDVALVLVFLFIRRGYLFFYRAAVAYKKGNDELGEQIDEVLTKFKEDGTIDNIMKHWIGSDPDHIGYVPDDNIERSSVLTMATNAEFPPYESMEDGKIVGIDVDIMNAVCDELALTLKIENMDFDNIIDAVDSEIADVGVAGMSVTPEREEIVSFTQSYAVSKQVIVVRKD